MSNVMMFCPTCSWLCHVWHTLAHVTVKEKRSIRARSVVPRITTGNTGGTRRPIRQRPLRACTNFHCRDIVSCPCTGTLPQPIFKSVILFYQNSHWFGFIQDLKSIVVHLSLNNSLKIDFIDMTLADDSIVVLVISNFAVTACKQRYNLLLLGKASRQTW